MTAVDSETTVWGPPAELAAGDLVYRSGPAVRFARAEGVRLFDEAGRDYLDAEACNGALSWGYDASILSEAMLRCRDLPAVPSFCESSLRVSVLSRLARRFEAAIGVPGRVAAELGGAQGIELALRIVAANRGGGPILTLQGGYHGRSPFTGHLSASARYRSTQPWPGPEVIRLPLPLACAGDHDGRPGGCACRDWVEGLGADDRLGVPAADESRPVAALVLEPLLNVAGCVRPDAALIRRLVDRVRALGGLIVVDEVFTGLYRLGTEWGFQTLGIEPDLVVASKALTNGATAFSCVWAREPLASPDVYRPGFHSSTFAGNAHALAVVDTVLDRWDAWPDPPARVAALERHLREGIEDAAAHLPSVRAVDVLGGVARIQLTRPLASEVRRILVERPRGPRMLVASTGMAPDVVILHPPLVTSPHDLDLMIDTLAGGLRDLEALS